MLQRHLQEIYEYLFDTAHAALKDGAAFAPFGAGTRKTGEQIHVKVDLAVERSVPQDHITALIAGFRQEEQEHGLIAAGLVFDGRAGSDDASALGFHIEGANGRAVQVIVPYARREASQIAFGAPQLSEVAAEIFTDVN